jgi:meiotic recombination protein REC8
VSRPEQLVLQDDPSFIPDFALPPPELLDDLNLGFNADILRSGESQSLAPFGSQQSSQSSHVGDYGLVLPSSSPDRPAGGGLEGDNGGQDDIDLDHLLDLEEPEFVFGEDGDIIEFTPGQRAPETPAASPAGGVALMHSDAGASARVRQEHGEGHQGGAQVSFSTISHPDHALCLLALHTSIVFVDPVCPHHTHTPNLILGATLPSVPL